ncbi:adenosylcobinamide-GDP ribazoletransferase [Paenibacillus pini]|uniref:Adenosylcobinamide-GDP ribazoletransferase n=1 Tax=Paenibacillus pini JCM 16418 TaxID=1236976 RepID=W7YF39_9BACL|nr:adenosylcobinamide-GDP ribazoletransferase [Paenibacillus pini]GAF06093.1 cobalamin synthase [Paenibacillus pini JCM 16418]
MSKGWQAAAAAFQFLSRFPVKANLDYTPALFQQSTRFYPLVGAAIGLCIGIIAAGTTYVLPAAPAAVLVLIVWVILTGGLHLDGWMDTADGLLSYRSRERMLEIMKDSRVGAMGVIACVLLLMLKGTLIYSLLSSSRNGVLPTLLLILPPIWSRWFMIHAMAGYPMARGKEGLAGANFNGISKKHTVRAFRMAAVLTLVITVLMPFLGIHDSSWLQSVVAWLGLPILAWLSGTWAARQMSNKLGGLTGDTYGALNEGIETVLLLFIVVLTQWM